MYVRMYHVCVMFSHIASHIEAQLLWSLALPFSDPSHAISDPTSLLTHWSYDVKLHVLAVSPHVPLSSWSTGVRGVTLSVELLIKAMSNLIRTASDYYLKLSLSQYESEGSENHFDQLKSHKWLNNPSGPDSPGRPAGADIEVEQNLSLVAIMCRTCPEMILEFLRSRTESGDKESENERLLYLIIISRCCHQNPNNPNLFSQLLLRHKQYYQNNPSNPNKPNNLAHVKSRSEGSEYEDYNEYIQAHDHWVYFDLLTPSRQNPIPSPPRYSPIPHPHDSDEEMTGQSENSPLKDQNISPSNNFLIRKLLLIHIFLSFNLSVSSYSKSEGSENKQGGGKGSESDDILDQMVDSWYYYHHRQYIYSSPNNPSNPSNLSERLTTQFYQRCVYLISHCLPNPDSNPNNPNNPSSGYYTFSLKGYPMVRALFPSIASNPNSPSNSCDPNERLSSLPSPHINIITLARNFPKIFTTYLINRLNNLDNSDNSDNSNNSGDVGYGELVSRLSSLSSRPGSMHTSHDDNPESPGGPGSPGDRETIRSFRAIRAEEYQQLLRQGHHLTSVLLSPSNPSNPSNPSTEDKVLFKLSDLYRPKTLQLLMFSSLSDPSLASLSNPLSTTLRSRTVIRKQFILYLSQIQHYYALNKLQTYIEFKELYTFLSCFLKVLLQHFLSAAGSERMCGIGEYEEVSGLLLDGEVSHLVGFCIQWGDAIGMTNIYTNYQHSHKYTYLLLSSYHTSHITHHTSHITFSIIPSPVSSVLYVFWIMFCFYLFDGLFVLNIRFSNQE